MDWMRRVSEIGVLVRNDDDAGRKGTWRALEVADVLWAAWSEDGRTPSIRVIRGRDLTGPNLRHGVLLVDGKISMLDLAETWDDEITTLDDGVTLDLPEPAVPQTHIDMVLADPVLLYDGTAMDFHASENA